MESFAITCIGQMVNNKTKLINIYNTVRQGIITYLQYRLDEEMREHFPSFEKLPGYSASALAVYATDDGGKLYFFLVDRHDHDLPKSYLEKDLKELWIKAEYKNYHKLLTNQSINLNITHTIDRFSDFKSAIFTIMLHAQPGD